LDRDVFGIVRVYYIPSRTSVDELKKKSFDLHDFHRRLDFDIQGVFKQRFYDLANPLGVPLVQYYDLVHELVVQNGKPVHFTNEMVALVLILLSRD
jgi:hypothetical protein